MPEKRRFLDVWIVEGNTVYKEVPFDVVADWVQQGRLLEDDMARPSGTSEWARLGDLHDFAVYVPKPAEPAAEVESNVEPLEPIESGFTWKRRPDDEDAEVDMIPLIDVSLVLLIVFMLLTTNVGGGGSPIKTPTAEFGSVVNPQGSVWVGIDLHDGVPVYSLGVGDSPAAPGDRDLPTRAALLDRLKALLANKGSVDLTINANAAVRSGDVRELTVELEREPFRSKIAHKYTGVSDKP